MHLSSLLSECLEFVHFVSDSPELIDLVPDLAAVDGLGNSRLGGAQAPCPTVPHLHQHLVTLVARVKTRGRGRLDRARTEPGP